jgi:hypothetical protein
MAMSHDIFVSYSSEDKAVADAVVSALENSGLRCWVAPRDIKPSADWGDSITEAISACKMVLLIFSGHSNRSKHVRDEIYLAISEEKTILPFRIENLDPTGSMRLHLSSRHWLDAYQPSWQTHIDRLVGSAADSLGHKLATPGTLVEAPAPVPGAHKQPGRKTPWLWIGLAAGAAAALSIAGMLWFGRGDSEGGPPTAVPAVQRAINTAPAPSMPTPTPESRTLIVTSAEDSGPGTLRQAVLDAVAGDTITFDPEVFPPDRPTTIFPINTDSPSALPNLTQGGITIDASNAGVILDGSNTQGAANGLEIYSDANTVMGLQIINFGAQGITICGGSANVVGGDIQSGSGPSGQGNLIRNNEGQGFNLCSSNTASNVIRGNVIEDNGAGIVIEAGPRDNTIGPGNTIANNRSGGVEIVSSLAIGNTITANSIYGNQGVGIHYGISDAPPYTYSTPPDVLHFDLEAGTANGQACRDCVVEIFSTDTQDGKVYEGAVRADEYGGFAFRAGKALSGPFLTATSSPPGLNTSEFSPPTPARSAIQIALDAIQHEAPLYQTSFDTWEFGGPVENARSENGKLIVTSEYQEHVAVTLSNFTSDKYAVEFELRFWEASPEGHCVFETSNDGSDDFWKAISYIFLSNGQMELSRYAHPEKQEEIAEGIAASRYDETRPNTAMLIVLGDQIAAFLNGQIAFTALDPDMSADYTNQNLTATYTIVCEFDNFRLWDLRGVDFNP